MSLSLSIPKLSESLEHQLESMVLSGVFWLQDPLPSERKLASAMDVSRTSIRYALARLAEQDLLVRGKRGYVVSNAIREELDCDFARIYGQHPSCLLTFWTAVAANVVAIANKKAKVSERVAIVAHVDKLRVALTNGDAKNALQVHRHLWRSLSEASYNFFLIQTIEALTDALEPVFATKFSRWAKMQKEFPEKECPILAAYSGLAQLELEELPLLAELEVEVGGRYVRGGSAVNDTPMVLGQGLIEAILRQPFAFEAVFELRQITEIHAAGWAAKLITPNGKDRLHAHLDKMTSSLDVNPEQYSLLDAQLHGMIAELACNPAYYAVQRCLSPIFSRTTQSWLNTHFEILNDISIIHLQHQRLADAIASGDERRARATMADHLQYVLVTLHEIRMNAHIDHVGLARQLLKR